MSKRTEQVYQFIKQYITANRLPPTRREIGRGCKLSTSVVTYHIHALQDAGRLNVMREKARGIVLVEEATK